MEYCPLGKLTVAQLVIFPALQGIQSLIPIFGRTCHWSLTSTRRSMSIYASYFFTINVNIILPRSFRWSLSFMFSHKNLVCIAVLCHVFHMSYPSIMSFLIKHPSIVFGEEWKSWSLLSSLCSFPQSSVTSSLLDSSFLLRTLLSDTHSHPYETEQLKL